MECLPDLLNTSSTCKMLVLWQALRCDVMRHEMMWLVSSTWQGVKQEFTIVSEQHAQIVIKLIGVL